jgi:hypothetical protein
MGRPWVALGGSRCLDDQFAPVPVVAQMERPGQGWRPPLRRADNDCSSTWRSALCARRGALGSTGFREMRSGRARTEAQKMLIAPIRLGPDTCRRQYNSKSKYSGPNRSVIGARKQVAGSRLRANWDVCEHMRAINWKPGPGRTQ